MRTPVRNERSRWCVARSSTTKAPYIGPIVWGWFRWRWQANRLRRVLERTPDLWACGYDWRVLSAAELDEAWDLANRAWPES